MIEWYWLIVTGVGGTVFGTLITSLCLVAKGDDKINK